MKRVAVLGSTGSVGTKALEVMARLGGFEVAGLSAYSNWKLLSRQAQDFPPPLVGIVDEEAASEFKKNVPAGPWKLLTGQDAVSRLVEEVEADLVLSCVVGAAGLKPALSALRRGMSLALANKEALVMAGELLMEEAERRGNPIIPVDSEHSAIFQVLRAGSKSEISRLILTASGGPFLHTPREKLHRVTPEEALMHPSWKMGSKVTVDSATLMNKAFEIVEAHYLFGVPGERIDVVIHPECLVHSFVEFCDGSLVAQMGYPDMRLPIQYALTFPERKPAPVEQVNLTSIGPINFHKVDREKFPALSLGYEAVKRKGAYGAALGAADEVAVSLFLEGRIKFTDICRIVSNVLERLPPGPCSGFDAVLKVAAWAREEARRLAE